MLNIFISSILSSIILVSYGALFSKLFFSKNLEDIDPWITGIYGFIITGFISLCLNFFFPINKIIGTIFLIFSLIFFIFYFIKLKKKNEFILLILFVSITSFLLITLSNINRPDAGLYHLPYISILQDDKIILGLANLHYRFGHTSIFQYISAIYNNYLIIDEFINFPLASLVPFYMLFLFKNLREFLNKKMEIEAVSIFLIIIFSLYSFNRYSNYGNDAPANIYFFILIVITLKIQNIKKINFENFFNISIISIFLLTIKPVMVIVFALPLFLFLLSCNKIKILKHRNSLICALLIISWISKNFLISGCAIFPIKETCIDKINYYNASTTITASTEAEAWSKAYPDSNYKLGYDEYNSNFNWVNTWFKSHFKVIIEKIAPFLLFLILFFLIKLVKRPNYNISKYKSFSTNNNILLILFFSFYCCFFWFLKFPVYRFGMAFISSFILFLSINLLVNNNFFYGKKNYYSIIGIGLILFYGKNINRIINHLDLSYNNFPWPMIYSMSSEDNNIKQKFTKISDNQNNLIYYYSGGKECMYSNSPCSNYYKKNILKKNIKGYAIYYLK